MNNNENFIVNCICSRKSQRELSWILSEEREEVCGTLKTVPPLAEFQMCVF